MTEAAAYQCDLGSNQWLHLSNDGSITAVAVASRGPGQQQQSSQGFVTGEWQGRPQVYRLAQGFLVVVAAAQSTAYLQIQAGQSQMLSGQAAEKMQQFIQSNTSQAVPMQSVAPPPAMPPMTPMAPMAMNLNPMSMTMGNMAMGIGSAAVSPAKQDSHDETAHLEKRFCTQCGSAVEAGDKFCGQCGDRLTA